MSEFKITLDGQPFTVTLFSGTATVDGKEYAFDRTFVGFGNLSLIIAGAVSNVFTLDTKAHKKLRLSEGNSFKINVNGHVHDVTVDTRRSILLKALRTKSISNVGPAQVIAPMPGMISKIEVKIGEQIKKGKGLVILEAMKMENEIRAQQAGRVTAINIKSGQAVEKGEVLLVIGPDDSEAS